MQLRWTGRPPCIGIHPRFAETLWLDTCKVVTVKLKYVYKFKVHVCFHHIGSTWDVDVLTVFGTGTAYTKVLPDHRWINCGTTMCSDRTARHSTCFMLTSFDNQSIFIRFMFVVNG